MVSLLVSGLVAVNPGAVPGSCNARDTCGGCRDRSRSRLTGTLPLNAQRRRYPSEALDREAGKRPALEHSLRSTPRRVRMRVGDTCQAHRCAGGAVGSTRITWTKLAARNRSARFPASRCVAGQEADSCPGTDAGDAQLNMGRAHLSTAAP